VRHVAIGSGQRVITNDRQPPPGHRIEFDLGVIQRFAPPGTIRLINPNGSFQVLPRGAPRDARDRELGHLEEDPLPLFIGIERAVLPDGTETLVANSGRDPLRSQAQELQFLGMIESFPNEPVSSPPHTTLLSGVLMRWYDAPARRHRYTTAMPGEQPSGPGRLSAELGRFCPTDEPGTLALVVGEDGYVCTARYRPSPAAPDLPQLARWSLAPLGWRGLGRRGARGRSAARRTASSARIAVRRRRRPARLQSEGHHLGFVYVASGPRRVELYSALHPVTGDQYLTHFPLEATDLGYGQVELLGYLAAAAPITGTLGGRQSGIAWASRFGLTARVRTY
jgi:hypothetical protein